jgi:hypothetical protein
MRREIQRRFVFFSIITLTIFSGHRIRSTLRDEDANPTNEILGRAATYCEKIASAALFFVCEERIREDIFMPPRRSRSAFFRIADRNETNNYVYDYQLITKQGRVEENRTLVEENGEKKQEKNAPLKTKRFYSLKSVYAPADFVGREAQALYSFKFLGEEKVLGRRAYLLKSLPLKDKEKNRSYGKIWVDREDFSVLKIERDQESIEGYEDLKEKVAKQKMWPILSASHEFGVEKNGIRFPGRTDYSESYAGEWIPKFKRSIAVIEYVHYKFFTVEVIIGR